MAQFFSRVCVLVFLTTHFWVSATESGLKIQDFQGEMKKVFPEADSFVEKTFLPKNEGGSSFIGLVARLLGEAPNKDYEGIDVPRYMYHAIKDKKIIGLGHGAIVDTPTGPASIIVFYDMDRKIRNLKVDQVPENILKELQTDGYLSQFIGYEVDDFEKQLTRRSRRRRTQTWIQGDFLTQAKRPKEKLLYAYWDKILRSVRFNAAFVDVAFFITKSPELEENERISNKAISGPEKEVEGTTLVTPEEGGSVLVQ